MIVKKNISKTLKDLDRRYNDALFSSSAEDSIYFSKLAILEYCGWIEDTLDKIVRRSVKNKLKTPPYTDMLRSTIKDNSGFQYKQNFRPMLTKVIGLVEMEYIEKELEKTGNLAILISELEAVKKDRDCAAHTWIKNATRTYPAPSTTKSRLENIYPITREIYSIVTRL